MEEQKQQKDEKIFSVSDYIKIVNQRLKILRSKITGEVSEVSFGPTGHVYFILKDEKDESVINCVIWKYRYDIYGIELKEGLKIIIEGCPNLHRIYSFKFIADVIEHTGEGTLKKEYEKLKERLAKEGLFEEDRKRPIPKYSQKVGIITSKRGDVLADFLNNLARFGFKVKMIDSRVEGQAAVTDLLKSVKILKKEDIEVLVIMRGGGSLESMLAFNNELLVREIINFPAPVIMAVGHHKDVPLAALAADCSVSTPSIAATTLNKSWEQAASLLKEYKIDIINSYQNVLKNADFLINESMGVVYKMKNLISDKYKKIEIRLKVSFQIFKNAIQDNKNNLKNSWKDFIFGFNALLLKIKQRLKYSEKITHLRNPETQLKFGYSIVRCNDRLIRSIRDIKIGEDVNIQIVDGIIISKVKKINA